jgi:hypothetical protein
MTVLEKLSSSGTKCNHGIILPGEIAIFRTANQIMKSLQQTVAVKKKYADFLVGHVSEKNIKYLSQTQKRSKRENIKL